MEGEKVKVLENLKKRRDGSYRGMPLFRALKRTCAKDASTFNAMKRMDVRSEINLKVSTR